MFSVSSKSRHHHQHTKMTDHHEGLVIGAVKSCDWEIDKKAPVICLCYMDHHGVML